MVAARPGALLAKLAPFAPLPLVAAVALKAMGEPVRPEDLWGHLALGRQIVASGSVPRVDTFSLLQNGAPYFDQPWLAQVVMYGVHRAGGLPALLAFGFLVVLAAEAIAVHAAVRRGASPAAAALVQFALGAVAARGWAMRPQVLVVPLFAAFVHVLTAFRSGAARPDEAPRPVAPLWALPVLMVLWANLHGTFPLGVFLVILALVAAVVDRPRAGGRSRGPLRALAVTAAACAVAPLVNPRGPALYGYVAALLGHPSIAIAREWQALSPATAEGACVVASLVAAAAVALRTRAPWGDVVFVTPFVVLAILAVRSGIWSSLALGPLLAGWLARRGAAPSPGRDRLPWVPAVALAAALLALPWIKPRVLGRPYGPLAWEPRTPFGAVEALRADPRRPARLFHPMGFGSYLMWALPSQRVFDDARLELYPRAFWDDVLRLSAGQDVDALLGRYAVDGLLVCKADQGGLLRAIRGRPAFELRYEDDDAAYFVRY